MGLRLSLYALSSCQATQHTAIAQAYQAFLQALSHVWLFGRHNLRHHERRILHNENFSHHALEFAISISVWLMEGLPPVGPASGPRQTNAEVPTTTIYPATWSSKMWIRSRAEQGEALVQLVPNKLRASNTVLIQPLASQARSSPAQELPDKEPSFLGSFLQEASLWRARFSRSVT